MHIGQNEDRRIRQFSLERLCVSIKHGQYSLVVINVTSERSSDGTTIILIETYRYLAQSHHTNEGRLP
jgi:hypothetical protein